MKILVIFPSNPYLSDSAASNRYIGLIEGLSALGCSITMLVTGGFHSSDEKETYKKVSHPDIDIIYSSQYVINGKLALLKNYFLSGLFDCWSSRLIKKQISGYYDIIWLGYDNTPFYSFCKYHKTIRGKSFIELNEFNDIGLIEKFRHPLQYRRANRENHLLLKSLKYIDIVAPMTKTLEMHYRQLTSNRCSFFHLPMTVNLSRFDGNFMNIEYQTPYIAYTGTMNNAKDGVDVLIKAFAKIADKYPALHLYLAGFWHYDVPMQDEIIKQSGLESRIHRLGVLTSEQIPPFVCNARLLTLARPDSHQAQGGFPTKLGEYLASGNPVCVTKVGEIPNYLKDNVSAFMATPGDIDSFADAMDRALCDADRALSVGANGRKVAESNFSADVQARRLLGFFNKVISNKI